MSTWVLAVRPSLAVAVSYVNPGTDWPGIISSSFLEAVFLAYTLVNPSQVLDGASVPGNITGAYPDGERHSKTEAASYRKPEWEYCGWDRRVTRWRPISRTISGTLT